MLKTQHSLLMKKRTTLTFYREFNSHQVFVYILVLFMVYTFLCYLWVYTFLWSYLDQHNNRDSSGIYKDRFWINSYFSSLNVVFFGTGS